MSVATKGSKEKTTDLVLTAQERNELKAKRTVLEDVLRRLGGATTAVTGQGRQEEPR